MQIIAAFFSIHSKHLRLNGSTVIDGMGGNYYIGVRPHIGQSEYSLRYYMTYTNNDTFSRQMLSFGEPIADVVHHNHTIYYQFPLIISYISR